MTKDEAITAFLDRFNECVSNGTFTRLTLSQPAPGSTRPLRVLGRLIDLRGGLHLSLTLRHETKDITRNLPAREAAGWLREQLGAEFYGAQLGTTNGDWQLVIPRGGQARLIAHKSAVAAAPSRSHDQRKEQTLDASANAWLHGLGVTDAAGKVRPAMADKHRQINRYLEILTHLARDCGWIGTPELTLADMGCGKGYLTFGAWHLFNRKLDVRAHVLGIETREDLVETTNALAQKIDAKSLRFVRGDIASAELPKLDALIALHACNTATDDAIRRGIELGAKLVIVAPCCHKELRPQLGKPEPLAAVLRHGIMEERLAEWLTDGLRALFLEWAGYQTKRMEFVSTEHTPKNLMLAAR